MRDFLLDLPNKELGLKTSDQWKKNHDFFWLILLDLDNFFDIYKEYGVKRSQEFFGVIADRVTKALSSNEFLAWMESDEFLILSSKKDDLERLIEKIFSTNSEPFLMFEKEFRLTYSLGISCFPKDSAYTRELVQKASLAKYQAKRKKSENSFQRFKS